MNLVECSGIKDKYFNASTTNMLYSHFSSSLARYMGSKRHIAQELEKLIRAHAGAKAYTVMDVGAGSGAISRIFRAQGWKVTAVDPALYTQPWNYYALSSTQEQLQREINLYKQDFPDVQDVVTYWNKSLRAPITDARPYFSLYYSPSNLSQRKYYMPHVARWFDRALYWHTSRNWSKYPLLHAHFTSEVLRLLINCANSSGTLKSFHSQWGGSSGHRLQELQELPTIKPLWSIEGPVGTSHTAMPQEKVDCIIFDPPSSVHQYAACYHLLSSFITGQYEAPAPEKGHGSKAGILPGQYSSCFSRYKQVEQAMNEWTKKAQQLSPLLVVLYPTKGGLLTSMEIGTLLQQHGSNTVIKKTLHDTDIYLVQTQQWQTPTQLKKQCKPSSIDSSWALYYDMQKLPKTYCLQSHGSKHKVIDKEGRIVALINKRYKVQWLIEETLRNSSDWQKAAMTDEDRFVQYLLDRQWLAAWTCLKLLSKSSYEYNENWTMLYHLAKSFGAHSVVQRMQKKGTHR